MSQVIISTVAHVVGAFGLIIQKLAHRRILSLPKHEQPRFFFDWRRK